MKTENTMTPLAGPAEAHCTVGAIDMGSKNFKFIIGMKVGGTITTELIRKERLELGKEVIENHGLIGESKIVQIEQTLSEFVQYCRDRGASEVLAIATSAIRNARNHQQIVDLAREAGLTIDLADGAREGEVGYFAATGGEPNRLVSDVGSKSMQIAWEINGKILSRSVPVGYELAYEGFVEKASSLAETEEMFRRFLSGNFQELPANTDQFVALAANTVTSFVSGKTPRGPHRLLTRYDLDIRLSELRALSGPQYDNFKSSLPDAKKILPGLVFLDHVMRNSGHDEVLITENELPVGLIVEYFLKREGSGLFCK